MATSSISGIASGIDWQQTVQLIMEIESQPMVALEERKATYESKLAAWQAINAKLLALNTAMEGMDELDEVLTKEASSSDTDVLTATATSGAATGSYSVLVNQLAQCAKLTHGGFVDANSTAVTSSDATFTYTYAGVDHTIDVPAGSTLTELVNLINSDVNNPGVVATILNDGSGSGTDYHLVLSGETGEDNTIVINDLETTLTGFLNGNFDPTQTAQNAQIRVDGYPPTTWIESDSNDVTEVIAGVTLNLKTTNALAVTVTISDDTEAAQTQIEEFVSAYNEVIALINSNVAYNAETETAGALFGDATVIGIKNDLQSIIASEVPGLLTNAEYKSLSEVGVKSGTGGLLTIDSSKLSDALEENFEAVGDLFAFTSTSTSNNLTYFTRTEDTAGGVYNIVAYYDATGQLLDTTTINGHPVQIEGDYIVGLDGYPEEGLRIQFTNPGGGAGSVSAEIRLGTGAAVEIGNRVSFLTDPIDGTVHYAEEGIEDTIDSIDEQIADWEVRLEATQAQLEAEFLAMETLISQLQSQGNYVSAMIANM